MYTHVSARPYILEVTLWLTPNQDKRIRLDSVYPQSSQDKEGQIKWFQQARKRFPQQRRGTSSKTTNTINIVGYTFTSANFLKEP